jgi:cbb3-type cytochrome oxidase subunit 3
MPQSGFDSSTFFIIMLFGAVLYWLFRKIRDLKKRESLAKFG